MKPGFHLDSMLFVEEAFGWARERLKDFIKEEEWNSESKKEMKEKVIAEFERILREDV